jgi:hypothetical protein
MIRFMARLGLQTASVFALIALKVMRVLDPFGAYAALLAPGVQTRGVFDAIYDNVDKSLYAVMKDRLKELPKIYPDYFNIKTSDRKFERVVSYVPFGDTQTKGEGDPYVMDELRQGYTKDFTHTENGLGFEVTQTALEDDPENILSRAGDWLAFSARYVEEGRAANPFNNGFTATTGELAPDGLSLFNASHVLKGGGGTWKNRPSTDADLSAASLQQALIDWQTDQRDEAGHLAMPVNDLILLVPPALEFLADRLLNSVGLPGSSDNDRNPIKSRRSWTIIVNPRLTDTDAWFVIAGDKARHALTFYRRVPITLDPMAIDPRTKNRIFTVRHRFSIGAWAAQGVYGSAGA